MNKFQVIKTMNTIIYSMNNEDAWLDWINVVPDQADDNDLDDIANDDELMNIACRLFTQIISEYGNDGYYIKSRLYGEIE